MKALIIKDNCSHQNPIGSIIEIEGKKDGLYITPKGTILTRQNIMLEGDEFQVPPLHVLTKMFILLGLFLKENSGKKVRIQFVGNADIVRITNNESGYLISTASIIAMLNYKEELKQQEVHEFKVGDLVQIPPLDYFLKKYDAKNEEELKHKYHLGWAIPSMTRMCSNKFTIDRMTFDSDGHLVAFISNGNKTWAFIAEDLALAIEPEHKVISLVEKHERVSRSIVINNIPTTDVGTTYKPIKRRMAT